MTVRVDRQNTGNLRFRCVYLVGGTVLSDVPFDTRVPYTTKPLRREGGRPTWTDRPTRPGYKEWA